MWMSEAPADVVADPIEVPFAMRLALIASVVLIVYLGVFPGATLDLARSSVGALSAVGPGSIGLAP